MPETSIMEPLKTFQWCIRTLRFQFKFTQNIFDVNLKPTKQHYFLTTIHLAALVVYSMMLINYQLYDIKIFICAMATFSGIIEVRHLAYLASIIHLASNNILNLYCSIL